MLLRYRKFLCVLLDSVCVIFIDKIRNFLTEFYSDGDSGKGKQFKYGRQLVCIRERMSA